MSPEQLSKRDIAKVILVAVDRRVAVDVEDITVRVVSPWDAIISFPEKTLSAKLRYGTTPSVDVADIQDIVEQDRTDHEVVLITPRDLTPACKEYIERTDGVHYIIIFSAPSVGLHPE